MIARIVSCICLLSITQSAWSQFADWNISEKDKLAYSRDGGNYIAATELQERPGVPKGKIKKYWLEDSAVYPGVAHDYWLYVPAQYSSESPNCLMVVLDGEAYLKLGIPTLMDNLIHEKQIPVMIGLFINAGPNGPGYPLYGGSDNRSIEYDSVNGDYARFLIEDVLPEVTKLYNITPDAQCHGIMGGSSGGAAAFGVAWHRPEFFSKVISANGSFVNIRGADAYPSMIRRAERKPIRVFLQGGSNDLDTIFGHWPLANQQMAAALAYREYDYRFEFGEGGHTGDHFLSLAAEAMRWLWRN
jgi:enterochelin esterase family protein